MSSHRVLDMHPSPTESESSVLQDSLAMFVHEKFGEALPVLNMLNSYIRYCIQTDSSESTVFQLDQLNLNITFA